MSSGSSYSASSFTSIYYIYFDANLLFSQKNETGEGRRKKIKEPFILIYVVNLLVYL